MASKVLLVSRMRAVLIVVCVVACFCLQRAHEAAEPLGEMLDHSTPLFALLSLYVWLFFLCLFRMSCY